MKKRWWHNSVAYQIYPKSFLDTNNDGIGDIKGITKKLDYLNDLGIDVLWISPFFKSPMADNGYDISNYKEIDPMFGTMDDFDELLEKANEIGIKILIDLVVNHTSDEHEWFKESRKSKDNPKRDWYIWRDGKQFNNWRSCFGGSVWEYDEETDSSYFHYFHKKQPCLNWENPEVRNVIYDMINWWLDKGIGGFRVDAINVIKKADLNQIFEVDGEDNLADARHGSSNIKGIEVFLDEMAQKTFNNYDIMTVAESDVPVEDQALWTGPTGFFDMAFQFKHSLLDIKRGVWHETKEFDLVEWKKAIHIEQSTLTNNTWAAVWLENHDNPRCIDKYLGEHASLVSAKMLATTYFFHRGTPFIYQGQEIGMRDIHYDSINNYDDIASIDQYQRALDNGYSVEEALKIVHRRSRDNTRYPMQWNNQEFYGFSTVKPWLDINEEYTDITVEKSLNDPNSLFYFYKELIQLRKNASYQEVFSYGSFNMLSMEDEKIYVYVREYGNKQVMMLANFNSEETTFHLDGSIRKILIDNYNEVVTSKEDIILKPFQGLVLDVLLKGEDHE